MTKDQKFLGIEDPRWLELKAKKALYATCPKCHSRSYITGEPTPSGYDPRLKQFICQWGHVYYMTTRYHRGHP